MSLMHAMSVASPPASNEVEALQVPVRARVTALDEQGWVVVAHAHFSWHCEVLETQVLVKPLAVGDAVLVLPPHGDDAAVVLGRVTRAPVAGQPVAPLLIQAPGGLNLQAGAASVTLSPDGRVMVRGEDVLIHAKGTQRIRAGTVAIN